MFDNISVSNADLALVLDVGERFLAGFAFHTILAAPLCRRQVIGKVLSTLVAWEVPLNLVEVNMAVTDLARLSVQF